MKLILRYSSLVILIIGVTSSSAAIQKDLSNQKNSWENHEVLNVAMKEDRFPVTQTTKHERDDAPWFTLDETVMKNQLLNLKNGTSLSANNFKYVVWNKDIPCILCNMTVSLSVPYKKTDGKMVFASMKIPSNAVTIGSCDDKKAQIFVGWFTANNVAQGFGMLFAKDDASFSVDKIEILLTTNEINFPGAVDEKIGGVSEANLGLFSAPVKDGIHKCSANTEGKAGNISYVISDVSLIAFNQAKNFSLEDRKEKHCETGSGVSRWWIVGGIFGTCLLIAVIGVVVYNVRRSTEL